MALNFVAQPLFDLKPYTVAKPLTHQIDAIFTTRPTDPAAWAADDAGMLVGCISTDGRLYNASQYDWCFKLDFIDNEFKAYDHYQHLEAVKFVKPKYATVRDLMTPEQCTRDGIEWYSFDQIMTWAEELKQYAQNVIIIPKYDCIGRIPEDYILGYSVETSYGGTPLEVERFKGRRVHLLGGRFDKQLKKFSELGDDVVSIDNNYIQMIAQKGDYITPDGKRRTLAKNGLGYLNNVRQTCLTLSFGAIMARLRQKSS